MRRVCFPENEEVTYDFLDIYYEPNSITIFPAFPELVPPSALDAAPPLPAFPLYGEASDGPAAAVGADGESELSPIPPAVLNVLVRYDGFTYPLPPPPLPPEAPEPPSEPPLPPP